MKKDLTILAIILLVLVAIVYFSWQKPRDGATTGRSATTTQEYAAATTSQPKTPSTMVLTAKENAPAEGLGVMIAPIEVVEDSRCPTEENIKCIQAGTVRVRTKITNQNGERIVVFSIGQAVISKTERIILTQVLPEARAAVPIVPNEYRFVFEITAPIE
jgi:hypothetical protein